MELMEITKEMYKVSQRLDKATRALYKLAQERAETERDYRMNLSMEITKLRAEGTSVTIIPDMARGNMSKFKFDRDLAEGRYRAAIESLRALESQLSALQSILKWQDTM